MQAKNPLLVGGYGLQCSPYNLRRILNLEANAMMQQIKNLKIRCDDLKVYL